MVCINCHQTPCQCEHQTGKPEAWEKTVISLDNAMNESLRIHMTKILETQAKASYEAGIKQGSKETYLLLQSRVGGVDEFTDYSPEGLREFRRKVQSIFKPDWQSKAKEWGLE